MAVPATFIPDQPTAGATDEYGYDLLEPTSTEEPTYLPPDDEPPAPAKLTVPRTFIDDRDVTPPTSPYEQALLATGYQPDPFGARDTELVRALTQQLPADIGKGLDIAGKMVKSAAVAPLFTAIGQPELAAQEALSPFGLQGIVPGGEPDTGVSPYEAGQRLLTPALRLPSEAATGLLESAPRLAASALVPEATPLVWGVTPEGFDVKQAAIATMLPGIGKWTGRAVEAVAKGLGVESEAANALINRIGGGLGAAGVLGVDQIRQISSLPADQQEDAWVEAVASTVSMAGLGMMGERARAADRTKPTFEQARQAGEAMGEYFPEMTGRLIESGRVVPEPRERLPKPTVPEIGTAERPSASEEIIAANATTIGEIQALFPGINRETAREMGRAAWGKWPPTGDEFRAVTRGELEPPPEEPLPGGVPVEPTKPTPPAPAAAALEPPAAKRPPAPPKGEEAAIQESLTEALGEPDEVAPTPAKIERFGVYGGSGPIPDRPMVVVTVNGQPIIFYRSSMGTSGKQEGGWYPMFGIGAGEWIVKGKLAEMTAGYGNPDIQAVMKALNYEFGHLSASQVMDALKKRFGEPQGVRQLSIGAYGETGYNTQLGVTPDGMIDRSTGVAEHINSILAKAKRPGEAKAPTAPAAPAAPAMSREMASDVFSQVSGMAPGRFFTVAQGWQKQAMAGQGQSLQRIAEAAARAKPNLKAWQKAYDDAAAEAARIKAEVKANPGQLLARQQEVMGAAQKAQFFSEGIKELQKTTPAKEPAAAPKLPSIPVASLAEAKRLGVTIEPIWQGIWHKPPIFRVTAAGNPRFSDVTVGATAKELTELIRIIAERSKQAKYVQGKLVPISTARDWIEKQRVKLQQEIDDRLAGKPPKKGAEDAERIREDEGRVPPTGDEPERGEGKGGADLERKPSGEPSRPASPAPVSPTKPVGAPQWAMDELVARGWDPKWPFIPADLYNADFRASIQADPSLSAKDKALILSFGPGGKNEIKATQVTPTKAGLPTLATGEKLIDLPPTNIPLSAQRARLVKMLERLEDVDEKTGKAIPKEGREASAYIVRRRLHDVERELAGLPPKPYDKPAPGGLKDLLETRRQLEEDLKEDANNWIGDILDSDNPPKNAEEAWKLYLGEIGKGSDVTRKDYFVNEWNRLTRRAEPAEPAAPAVPAAQKQPWEMTQAEFDAAATEHANKVFQARKTGTPGMVLDAGIGKYLQAGRRLRYTESGGRRKEYLKDKRGDWEVARRLAVEEALATGKSIPADILAEYPDLQKPAPEAPTAPTEKIPTVNEIQAQRTKVQNLERKLKKMTAMVPPPIRQETANYLAEQRAKLEQMVKAFRSQAEQPAPAPTEPAKPAAPVEPAAPTAPAAAPAAPKAPAAPAKSKFASDTEHRGIKMKLIGDFEDLVAYYQGSDGQAWAFHSSGRTWSNEGPIELFKAQFAGRRKGRLFEEPKAEPAPAKPIEPKPAIAKAGDTITFTPRDVRWTPTSGKVVEVIHNTEGEPGYHIFAPLPKDPSRTVRVWERDGNVSVAPKPSAATPQQLEALLREEVPDVAKAKANLRGIEAQLDPLRARRAEIAKEMDALKPKITLTRGPRYLRGSIKKSAPTALVHRYRALQKEHAEIYDKERSLEESGREDQNLIDRAVDAGIINDTREPLLRRVDRKIRLLQDQKKEVPDVLVDFANAETARLIRQRYPDATLDEINRLSGEVRRQQYFSRDPWEGINQIPDIYTLRRQALDAAVNHPDTLNHLFSDELRAKIDRFREDAPQTRTRERLDALLTEIRQFSETKRAELKAEEERKAKLQAEYEAQEQKLFDEAQKVADSMPHTRDAKLVKTELIGKIKRALQDLIDKSNVKLTWRGEGEPQPTGEFVAETESGPVSMGIIERTSGGKYEAEARIPGGQSVKGTFDTLEDAHWLIRGLAASQPGKIIIGVPGDGVFRVYASGAQLLNLWQAAKGIDTTSGYKKARYKTGGDIEKPITSIKTLDDWREAKKFHGLEDTDEISTWSPALAELAKKVNPKNPEKVTTAAVEDWIEKVRKQKEDKQRGGPGAQTRGEPAYPAIEQLSDQLKAVPPTGDKEALTLRQQVAKAWSQGRSLAEVGLGSLQAISQSLKDVWRGVRLPTGADAQIGLLDWMLQKSSAQSRMAGKAIEKQLPNESLRRAVALWIDTPGTPREKVDTLQALRARLPARTPAHIRQAIDQAINLPEEGLRLASVIEQFYSIREQDAITHGIFGEMDQHGRIIKGGLDDYFTHVWGPDERNWPDDLRAAISNGRVNSYWQFGRHRRLGQFAYGILQGKVPELDPAKVIPYYNYTLDRAIASRAFIKNMTDTVVGSDGRAALAPSGTVNKVGDAQAPDTVLINPRGRTDDLSGYRAIDHPSLRKWKWMVNDENGTPTISLNDLLVHPEFHERLSRFMDRSRLTPTKWGRKALRLSTEVKGFKLGLLSLFHQVHVGSHALWHWTSPFKFDDRNYFTSDKQINWDSPAVRYAVEKGHLKLAPDPNELAVFAEGLLSPGLVHKLPIVGAWSRAYSEFVFGEYIPKLKLKTFANALPRNQRWYAGKLTPDEIASRVGDAVNNAYGELNTLFLGKFGRDPGFQRLLRGVFLAPDFGEARLRFVEKTFTRFGQEERLAAATMVATLWLAARVANWASHGDPEAHELKRAFSVKVGDHWYSMRSVAGDVLHAFTDTGRFLYVRLNPLYSRTAADWLFGRDVSGRRLSPWEKFVERPLEQLVPIQFQGLTRDDQKLWESALTSIGVGTQHSSVEQDIREKSRHWMKSSGFPRAREEWERRQQAVYPDSIYKPLRMLVQGNDIEAIRNEIKALVRNEPTPERKKKRLNSILQEFNPRTTTGLIKPFATNDRKFENAFVRSLDGRGKREYVEALRQQARNYQKIKQAVGINGFAR